MFQNCLHVVCSKEHTHLNFWLWELKITNAHWQRCPCSLEQSHSAAVLAGALPGVRFTGRSDSIFIC